jgi:hypothetical protein
MRLIFPLGLFRKPARNMPFPSKAILLLFSLLPLSYLSLGFHPSSFLLPVLLALLLHLSFSSSSLRYFLASTILPLLLGLSSAYFEEIHAALRSPGQSWSVLLALGVLFAGVPLMVVWAYGWAVRKSRVWGKKFAIGRVMAFPVF